MRFFLGRQTEFFNFSLRFFLGRQTDGWFLSEYFPPLRYATLGVWSWIFYPLAYQRNPLRKSPRRYPFFYFVLQHFYILIFFVLFPNCKKYFFDFFPTASLRFAGGFWFGFSTPSLLSETPYENPLEGTPFFIFIVFNNMHFFLWFFFFS